MKRTEKIANPFPRKRDLLARLPWIIFSTFWKKNKRDLNFLIFCPEYRDDHPFQGRGGRRSVALILRNHNFLVGVWYRLLDRGAKLPSVLFFFPFERIGLYFLFFADLLFLKSFLNPVLLLTGHFRRRDLRTYVLSYYKEHFARV